MFNLKEIKLILNINYLAGDENKIIEGISTDSRNISKGELFIPLKGDSFDGHDFLEKVSDKGISWALKNEGFTCKITGDIELLEVEDTLKAYQMIANFYRKKNNFKVVGITGSSGKTTTKDLIYNILSKKYKVNKTIGNNNNEIGVPLTLLSARPETEIIVVEMGMRALNEISDLTKIAEPNIGIVTNIGTSHIGELKGQENIFKAKSELFLGMNSNSYSIINGSDSYGQRLRMITKGDSVLITIDGDGDVNISDFKDGINGMKFSLKAFDENLEVNLPFKGLHIALDCVFALLVGYKLGITLREGIKILGESEISGNRMREEFFPNGITVLNDTYNANPDSTKASLNILKVYEGKKIAILGDMRELGDQEEDLHRKVGEYAANIGVDILITTGVAGRYISESAIENGLVESFFYESKKDAFNKLMNYDLKDSTILIKGSRLVKMELFLEFFRKELI